MLSGLYEEPGIAPGVVKWLHAYYPSQMADHNNMSGKEKSQAIDLLESNGIIPLSHYSVLGNGMEL